MNQKKLLLASSLLIFALGLVSLVKLLEPHQIFAAANTTLSLSTANSSPSVGSTFTVSVDINTGSNSVVGTQLALTFDASKLQAQDIVAGSFFPNATTTQKNIDNTAGTVSFWVFLPPAAGTPAQGQGSVAQISFTATQPGSATIGFSSSTLVAGGGADVGQNVLQNSTPLTIGTPCSPHTVPGDVNDSGCVDISDYSLFFAHFGSKPPSLAGADMNCNGEINLLDYSILFQNYGQGCTAGAGTTLSFSTANSSPSVDSTFTVSVDINTGSNSVVGTQLALTFDASKLQAQDIVAGSFFPNATTTQKNIDNTAGTVSFWVFLPPAAGTPAQGQGSVAQISFTATQPGSATIGFSSSTLVAGGGADVGQNVLSSTTALTVGIIIQ